jgi:RNase P/RNase MRP subunit p30
MRAFDLHVRVNNRDNGKELENLVAMAQDLTFTGLALDSSKPFTKDILKVPLKLIRRQTLAPRSATRLKQYIGKNRSQAEILVIHGRTKPIWLAAAELSMIDMVMLRDIDDFTKIDSQIARAMATHKKPVEVCLNGLLTYHGTARSKLIRVMSNAIEYLVRANCSLILTSGAINQWELRAPRDLAALGYLVNIPENLAKTAIFDNPLELLSKIMTLPEKNLLKQGKRKS